MKSGSSSLCLSFALLLASCLGFLARPCCLLEVEIRPWLRARLLLLKYPFPRLDLEVDEAHSPFERSVIVITIQLNGSLDGFLFCFMFVLEKITIY